ncbi:MAG: hypothetical protein L3J88_08295 [Gammaproteobacteria bacterium]|nr:hypothetical protein [Gammaproteobacteria bacterium]MCF6363327.1 hypothetical protein [Gammaproteobacteria bacterium]
MKTKLLGVVMVSLGVLDSLLTLRGGLPSEEYILLIVLGIAVFIIGAIRAGRQSDDPADEQVR